jgi:hypothetical protein
MDKKTWSMTECELLDAVRSTPGSVDEESAPLITL